jgi:hypothetical protein
LRERIGYPIIGLTHQQSKLGIYKVRSLENMNVKVFATVLLLGVATTLGACGGAESDKPATPGSSPSATASPST